MKREEKATQHSSLLSSDRNQTQCQAHGEKMPLGALECYTWLTGAGWDHNSKWPWAALLWGYSEYGESAVQVSCDEAATKTYFHALVHTDMQPRSSSSQQKLFVIFTLRGSGVFLENWLKHW